MYMYRDTPEYTNIVEGIFKTLYKAQNDYDGDVCRVSDECVVKVIKLLTPQQGELFCYNLIRILQAKKSNTGKTRKIKSALKRLSEVCQFLTPQKAKLYVGPVLSAFISLVTSEDESLLVKKSLQNKIIIITFIYLFIYYYHFFKIGSTIKMYW